jgi:hypothetical protein
MKKAIQHLLILKCSLLVTVAVLLSLGCQAQTSFFLNLDTTMQVTYLQPFTRPHSNDIEITFTYTNPTGNPAKYLNIYVKLPTGVVQIWAAENLMLDTFSNTRTLTYTINLSMLGVKDGDVVPQLDVLTVITDTLLTVPRTFPPPAFQRRTCGTSIWNYGSGVSRLLTDSVRRVPSKITRPGNNWIETDSIRRVTRGCRVANIDLDSGAHNSRTTPGYAGDWNACGPASCANSLQWLEERYPTKLATGLTLRQKLEELSKQMKRRDNEGVYTDTMLSGKLAFIDKYKLPIRVKFQSVYYKDSCYKSFDPTYNHCAQNQSRNGVADTFRLDFDWLYNEMKHGEDIEMNIGWWQYDSSTNTGSWAGGHAVVITGVEDIHGVKRITIKDDSTQAGPGGLRERPLTMDSTGWTTYAHRLREWSSSDPVNHRTTTAVIKDFISESFDSTVTFVPIGVHGLNSPGVGMQISGNPVSAGSSARITLNLESVTKLRLIVTDISGRIVSVLAEGSYQPGTFKFYWPGTTSQRENLPGGMYFIMLMTDRGTLSGKVVKE